MKTIPLRNVAEVRLGRQRSPQNAEGPHMVRYLRAANVKSGRLELEDVKEMNFTPEEQAVFRLEPGDVLVTEGAGSLDAVGASAPWRGELAGTVCVQNTLVRLRPRPNTDPRFLAWWAEHAYASRAFASFATGANIFHLGAEGVRGMPVPDLALENQQRISDFLDAETTGIDALIETKRRMADVLRERSHGYQAALVTGRAQGTRLRPSGIRWLGAIPTDWPVERLKYLAQVESGHTPSRTRPELWEDCTIPWITLNDVGRLGSHEFIDTTVNRISEAGLAASSARVLPAGTVVLSRDATIGRTAIMGTAMATSQHFADWICGPRLRPRYLWLLFSTVMRSHFESMTDGATLRTIGMPDVREFRVPIPTLDEQDWIVDRASAERATEGEGTDLLQRQLNLLAERRRALITAAVTGELAVA